MSSKHKCGHDAYGNMKQYLTRTHDRHTQGLMTRQGNAPMIT